MNARVWVAIVALASACKRPPPEAEPEAPAVRVTCAPAVRTTLHPTRVLRGTVVAAPDHDAVISAQVPGRIVRVIPREGDRVAVDQPVAEIESQPVRDALVQARAQLAQAEAGARNASLTEQRLQHLFDRGIAARQEVDDASARHQEAEAGVAAARAAVDLAERNVGRATVRSPIAGVVIHVLRRPGELVDGTPATPVVEVADPDALEFLATATPADLVQLHPDQPATLHFDSLPDAHIEAHVRIVSPAIDPATGVGSVRLTIPQGPVRPPFGLFGVAAVELAERGDVLVVPSRALRNAANGGTEVVLCGADGAAHARAVEVGTRQGEVAEVTRGVAPGERVVVQGALGLADGARIEEVNAAGDAGM